MRTLAYLLLSALLLASYFVFATILLIYDQYIGLIILTIGYLWLVMALANEEDKRRAAKGRSHRILNRDDRR